MTLSRIRNHSFKFVEVEEFELDEMDAGKEEAKLEKQYSSSPSSDKSAAGYVGIIHMIVEFIFCCLLICHFQDGIIPLPSYLSIVIPGRFK